MGRTGVDGTRQQRRGVDGCRFAAPPQGLFGWVDVGVDTQAMAQAMLDEGWLIAPGSLFTPRRGRRR